MGEKKKKKLPDRIHEQPVTYDIYYNLPDDGNRYEVADGKLELMSPGPTMHHQLISFELQKRLDGDCRNDYLIISAPIDVKLSDTEVRQPDIVMVYRSRIAIVEKRCINGAPDLVVEIVSEHSRRRDKVQKTKAYAKHGVPEYWIVDPASETLEQYVLGDGAYELVDVFEGDERVRSSRIACASFTMRELLRELPDIPH